MLRRCVRKPSRCSIWRLGLFVAEAVQGFVRSPRFYQRAS